MALAEFSVGVLGGPQGPKALLDAVRVAIVNGSIDTLSRLAREFLSISDNVAKCVDASGNTVVHLAVGKDTQTLQYVLDTLRPNINATNYQGRTALHEAVTHNYTECCALLLDSGADDAVQSATLSTPFHTAAACGSVECMEVLLQHSSDAHAKVNELDKNKSSALHKCAFDGDVRVSRWLVEHGAVVDARDSGGLTPLLVAVKMGQYAVAAYLLARGASSNAHDVHGNTGVHFCAIRCDTATLRLLLHAGANARVQNGDCNNALHLAALHQRPDAREWEELVVLLLEAGCDAQQRNTSGKTPADYVNRSLKRLFTRDEVTRRHALQLQAARASDEELERALALRSTWRAALRQRLTRASERAAAEDERLAREAEEQARAEDDARTALEEVVETIRHCEDEIAKRKAALEKANERGAGK